MSSLRVRVYPADQWGCGHYRMIWPARAAHESESNVDVHVVAAGEEGGISLGYLDGQVVNVQVDADTDVIVFQRPSNKLLVDAIRILRERGHTIVVDMDDDLSRIHPANAAFHLLHPKWSPHNNWHYVTEACKLASLVTVSTPTLASRYGLPDRVLVLPNRVPQAHLSVERPETGEELTWGWAGALHSHPNDVPLLAGVPGSLVRDGYPFKVIGRPEGVGRAVNLPEDPPGTGHVDFDRWPHELTKLAVGVAPLADTRFNEAKSWLKPLEYAALGVPWVASDRHEYRRFAAEGPGGVLVGDRTRDWIRALRELLSNDERRRELGEAARATAARHTVEEHGWRWAEAWQRAYDLDRGRAPASVVG